MEQNKSRHLRGHWLAYWERELGMFSCSQQLSCVLVCELVLTPHSLINPFPHHPIPSPPHSLITPSPNHLFSLITPFPHYPIPSAPHSLITPFPHHTIPSPPHSLTTPFPHHSFPSPVAEKMSVNWAIRNIKNNSYGRLSHTGGGVGNVWPSDILEPQVQPFDCIHVLQNTFFLTITDTLFTIMVTLFTISNCLPSLTHCGSCFAITNSVWFIFYNH